LRIADCGLEEENGRGAGAGLLSSILFFFNSAIRIPQFPERAMIPLGVDVPMKRLPWANWGLIGVTVLISLAVPYSTGERFHLLSTGHSDHLSALVLDRKHFGPHQVVTYLFQHAGLMHLIGNMLFLFVFGNAINAKLGHVGFLASYLGIGALVGLCWLAFGGGTACLGASGAIMGMCGMFLVLYPRNDVNLFWDEFELMILTRSFTGTMPGWVLVCLFLAFDLWGAIFDRHSGVGYVSHIIGGLTGVALAITLLKSEFLTPDRGEQTLLMWMAGEGPAE
jgi:membrane associated rhomboid family serine protease